jgi:glycosyltransferase involved in cell wall biosynthesis
MRLVLFHPSFEAVGGAEILAAEQAKLLRAAGHEVRLVTLGFDASRWQPRLDGMRVDLVRKRHWKDLLTAWTRVAKLRARGGRAAEFLRDGSVVLAYNYPCNAMLGMAETTARKVWQCNEPPRSLHMAEANPHLHARVKGGKGMAAFEDSASLKFSMSLAKYEADMAKGGSLHARRQFDLQASSRLDSIFAISEFSRDNARKIYGRCNEEVVYPAVRFTGPSRSRRGLDRSGLKVLVHSRIEAYKNIDTVMRGFRRFRDRIGSGAELHIVGEGPEKPRLQALAGDLFPGGGATFHGYLPQEELLAIYEACDVFALLPLDEPFGMVFPEAASRGLTLIGSDHGGPMEILAGGELGQVVDAFNPEALSEALEKVWAMGDEELERQREAADRACRSRFSAESVLPALIRALSP